MTAGRQGLMLRKCCRCIELRHVDLVSHPALINIVTQLHELTLEYFHAKKKNYSSFLAVIFFCLFFFFLL